MKALWNRHGREASPHEALLALEEYWSTGQLPQTSEADRVRAGEFRFTATSRSLPRLGHSHLPTSIFSGSLSMHPFAFKQPGSLMLFNK